MNQTPARGLTTYLESIGYKVIRYGNASHAFKDVLLNLRKKKTSGTPKVLMPSFIPAKLYRTIVAAGYEPKFYDIFGACRFDPQQIEDLIDDDTTSIFAVHYFGHPADFNTLREIAARKSVALVEDCAHVLLGSLDGRALGTLGDFSIFSTRKMLQLSDGGLLLLNNQIDNFKPSYRNRVRSLYTASMFFLSRAKRFYLKATGGSDPLHLVRPTKVGKLDPSRELTLEVKRMSYLSTVYEKTSDIRKNSATRRENYQHMMETLVDFDFLSPLYVSPPVEWTPYSLPMLVEPRLRTALQAELLKHGISCGLGWPEAQFGSKSPRTRELVDSLIEFPVHPLVVESQFDKMADACSSFGRKYAGR